MSIYKSRAREVSQKLQMKVVLFQSPICWSAPKRVRGSYLSIRLRAALTSSAVKESGNSFTPSGCVKPSAIAWMTSAGSIGRPNISSRHVIFAAGISLLVVSQFSKMRPKI